MRRLSLATFLVAALAPCVARADAIAIGAEGGVAIPIANTFNPPSGNGVDGRLGYRIDLGRAFVEPEIGAGFVAFDGVHASRFVAGARLGLLGPLRPQIYGAAGVGVMGFHAGVPAETGYRIRGGAALDIMLIPLIGFGAQGGIDVDGGEGSTFRYFDIGLHVGLSI